MCWLKRDLWKAGIACAGMLFLLVAITGLPVSAVDIHEEIAGLAGPGTVTVQATPTEDATVTALNKEKLAQEVQQLKYQNEPDQFGWLRTNASIFLSTLVVVIGGLFGLWRWRVDRRDAQDKDLKDHQAEREKRGEERFLEVVAGLSSEREEAKVGAAITLRTFLRPGYEQFYTQAFDLAVAHLRLPSTSPPSEDPDGIPHSPEDPNTPLPLTSLRQALIDVFKEAFPLVRDMVKKQEAQFRLESLDASRIQLDSSYLDKADLKQAFIQHAFLKKVHLRKADLSDANLIRSDLSDANLSEAKLIGAYFGATKLMRVTLNLADLSKAYFTAADLSDAILRESNLSGAHLGSAKLIRVDLNEADLSGANPEDAQSLEGTDLRGVIGLTKKQLEACKVKGAIIDEDIMTSSSQSTISSTLPSQSNNPQAPLAPSAQGNIPTSNADGSSATSSKPSLES